MEKYMNIKFMTAVKIGIGISVGFAILDAIIILVTLSIGVMVLGMDAIEPILKGVLK